MRATSAATRRKIDLAGIGLGIGEKLGNRFGRKRWIDNHDGGVAADARDRCDVAEKNEIEFIVEGRVDRVRPTDKEERIAVRGCTHNGLGSNVATCTGPVLDDKWLTEPFR